MDASSPERWQHIETLLDAALELPASERTAYLRAACGDDDELLAEVTGLLEAGAVPASFLDSPGAAFAADLVARSSSGATAPEPMLIGPWRIVRELGRGGMGAVYLAERETHFRQRAALKLVRRGLHLDEDLVRRFVEERQILASLEHANIARLLDGGVTADGVPWFAMEYVEGEAIDRWCDARRLSIDARLELFCTVCDAVAYAHRQQIVHRDLKPSNIHVREDGTVKLLDFGIARLVAPDIEAEAALTRTGLRVFTPEYASPEQIRGKPATPASDVFSLGTLLFELLTGRRPYEITGRSTSEVEQAVLTREPTRPSQAVLRATGSATGDATPDATATQLARARESTPERLSQRLRGELDRVVLQAMAKEPARRYESAEALVTDVRRHLDGLPVSARPRVPRARVFAGLAALAALAISAALLLIAVRFSRAPASSETPVLAVGLITDYRTDTTTALTRPLADLLAMNLARLPGLRVISSARIYEVMAQLGGTADDPGTYSAAARRAGATGLLDGAVFALDGGGLRLDLRRVDLATGDVIAVHSVNANDLFALVDSGTARLAADAGLLAPSSSIADVTTHSEIAYRLYEEGVRAYYLRDWRGAQRLLDAALAEDSALAMASYYLAQMAPAEERRKYVEHALRVAGRTSDRERLIIRAFWADWTFDPSLVATAETLAIRYPNELDGHMYSGRALFQTSDYPGALRRFRQVVEMDSAALRGNGAHCSACDALVEIMAVYSAMDSLRAVVREARAWTAVQPQIPGPWLRLATILGQAGDVVEARRAYQRAAELDPMLSDHPFQFAYLYMTGGDFRTADAELREIIRSGAPSRQPVAISYLVISLRWQGRFAEALQAIQPLRTLAATNWPGAGAKRYVLHEAQLLFELGRYREALTLFDSAAQAPGLTPSLEARDAAVALAHGAAALAALQDTSRLTALADTIERLGTRSVSAGDRRLHHYVRGLLHTLRGDDQHAVEEFRRAMVSPMMGSSRPHYALGRTLLKLGRPREAIAALSHAAIGPIEGNGQFITRPQIEEIMAQAWDALGVVDSAVVHYRNLARAWQNPDPILLNRARAVRSRLATLEATTRRN